MILKKLCRIAKYLLIIPICFNLFLSFLAANEFTKNFNKYFLENSSNQLASIFVIYLLFTSSIGLLLMMEYFHKITKGDDKNEF